MATIFACRLRFMCKPFQKMKHMLMRLGMLSHTMVFDSASQASVVTIAII